MTTLFVQLWGGIDEAVLGDIALKYNLSDDVKQRLRSELVLLKGLHRGNKSALPKDAASSTAKHMQQLGVALGKVDALLKAKEHSNAIYAASRTVFANRHAADAVDEVTAMFTKLQSDITAMRGSGYFDVKAADIPQQQQTPRTTHRSDLIGFRLPALYAEVTGKEFGITKGPPQPQQETAVNDEVYETKGVAFVNMCLLAMRLDGVEGETIASHFKSHRRKVRAAQK